MKSSQESLTHFADGEQELQRSEEIPRFRSLSEEFLWESLNPKLVLSLWPHENTGWS